MLFSKIFYNNLHAKISKIYLIFKQILLLINLKMTFIHFVKDFDQPIWFMLNFTEIVECLRV